MRIDARVKGKIDVRAASTGRLALTKLILVTVSTLIALLAGEIASRTILREPGGPFAHNPVIQKQADNVSLFEPEEYLGHRLKGGGLVGVYSRGLVTPEAIAADQTRLGRRFVLNLGDSSTSGWDSNVVVGNRLRHQAGRPLKSPFQTYRTYSTVLADDHGLYVANAGVPGYTSLQGVRYLRRLLERFRELGVRIDLATVYFGNNDSAWNGNIQDVYSLPGGFHLQLPRVLDQSTSGFRVVPRVLPNDYAEYLREIITLCRDANIEVVLIEPVVPRVWPPGLRAEGLEEELAQQQAAHRGTEVWALLAKARERFREGEAELKAGHVSRARALFNAAREADYVVPRIKQSYIVALRQVANATGVPLVSVEGKIPLDDSGYFLDYCHPIEPANRLIARGILDTLRQGFKSSGRDESPIRNGK